MRALVFDTETTDLLANPLANLDKQPRIAEFCGMLVEPDGSVSETLDFMCNPGIPMSKEAAQITGLTDDKLAGHPPLDQFVGAVAGLVRRADAIVAHNLFFDLQVMELEFARLGISGELVWPNRKICTVVETEWVQQKRMKLGDLYEFLFNERFSEAHRAKNDVAALVRIYNEMRKREWL